MKYLIYIFKYTYKKIYLLNKMETTLITFDYTDTRNPFCLIPFKKLELDKEENLICEISNTTTINMEKKYIKLNLNPLKIKIKVLSKNRKSNRLSTKRNQNNLYQILRNINDLQIKTKPTYINF